jgi:hypothetical protein
VGDCAAGRAQNRKVEYTHKLNEACPWLTCSCKRSMPGMATKPLGSFKTQLLRFRILAHCQAADGTHEAT